MAIFGIDVSVHNGTIDWGQVGQSGVDFAIAKATEGNGYVDPRYAANIAGMKANGILPGAYHFLVTDKYGATGAIQCDYFLSHIGDPTGLLVGIDIETETNLSAQPGTREVVAFCQRWHQLHPDHPLLIYLPRWYWSAQAMSGNIAQYGPNWQSRYLNTLHLAPASIYKSVPSTWWALDFGGWSSVTLLQFTSTALINGIAGNVDANAFQGTLTQLTAYAGVVLPDTASGADVASNISSVTPYPVGSHLVFAPGTYTGWHLDGSKTAITVAAGGSSASVAFQCVISQNPQIAPNGTFRFILNGGLANCFIPANAAGTSVTLPPAPVVDCTAQVTAATTPLNDQITSLKSEVTALENDVAEKGSLLTEANQRITTIKGKVAATAADIAND